MSSAAIISCTHLGGKYFGQSWILQDWTGLHNQNTFQPLHTTGFKGMAIGKSGRLAGVACVMQLHRIYGMESAKLASSWYQSSRKESVPAAEEVIAKLGSPSTQARVIDTETFSRPVVDDDALHYITSLFWQVLFSRPQLRNLGWQCRIGRTAKLSAARGHTSAYLLFSSVLGTTLLGFVCSRPTATHVTKLGGSVCLLSHCTPPSLPYLLHSQSSHFPTSNYLGLTSRLARQRWDCMHSIPELSGKGQVCIFL